MTESRLRSVRRWPVPVRYGLTAVLVTLAVMLGRTLGGPPFLFLIPAILLIAVLFDHGASLFATLLAAGLAVFLLFDPKHLLLGSQGLLGLLVFLATGWGIGALVEAMREAIDRLSDTNAALLHASQESDRRMRLLNAVIDGAPDPVYIKDVRGRFLHVNGAAADLLGTTVALALGNRDRDFLPPDIAEAIEAADAGIMTSGVARVVEERVAVAGAPVRIFLSSKFPWTDADGTLLGLIGISRDITDRKDAEVRLKSADAQKELLLEDINHRVKNHLQTVAGLMTVAGRRAASLDAAKDVIDDAVSRLSVLAQVYTRLQVGSGASAVDAKGFIVDLCHDLNATLVGRRPVAIDCDVESAALDSSRAVTLGLVINELVQNALKYAFPNERSGTVRVGFRRDGDSYRLTVADDGVGIDPDAQPRGTGNGRRLMAAMAQQLGGSLSSESSNGSRFTLVFPIDPGDRLHG